MKLQNEWNNINILNRMIAREAETLPFIIPNPKKKETAKTVEYLGTLFAYLVNVQTNRTE